MPHPQVTDRPYVLGIDPGYSGALALYSLESQELIQVLDMPIKKWKATDGSQITRVNLTEVSVWVDMHRDMIRGVVIEDVHAVTDQGVKSVFNFGFSTGALHGILSANLLPIFTVRPNVWKINLGLSKDKNLSRQKAMVDFPSHKTNFMRSKDDGRAEAALLAKYGERIFGKQKPKHLI